MSQGNIRCTRSVLAVAAAVVLALLVAIPAHAFKRWDMGARGGVNIAGLYGTDADTLGTDTKSGFTGGAWGTTWINEGVGIRLEVLFTKKGAHKITADQKVTAHIDYIDFPLLVVFRRELTPRKSYITMETGPVFSVKTNADIDNGNDLDATTSSFDFAGTVGFGLAFEVGFHLDVIASARYTVGFVSIEDHSGLDYRNYGIGLTAGIQRRFGYW